MQFTTGTANEFTGPTLKSFLNRFNPIWSYCPDYHFLSFSVLNLFPATVYAMPLRYVAQVDPVHIPV
jgi:hypothetical protein